jgi:hypothetical protein
VEIAGADGQPAIYVTAPIAFAGRERLVPRRLGVRETRIELWVDGAGNEAVLVDPVWSTAAPLSTARNGHIAVAFPSGGVPVAGGSGLASAEEFDPPTGTTSTIVGPMGYSRSNAIALLLPNNKVLASGGHGSNGGSATYLKTAEIYDPTSKQWAPTNSMNTERRHHAAAAISGRAQVAGGQNVNGNQNSVEGYDITTGTTAWLYIVATRSWAAMTNTMAAGHCYHAQVVLADGRVLVAGGSATQTA